MPIDELKKLCGKYYGATETKENGVDKLLYRTIPIKGIKCLSLGYFDTEYDAVSALYTYLTTNKMI